MDYVSLALVVAVASPQILRKSGPHGWPRR
jgi:hypothetical protein